MILKNDLLLRALRRQPTEYTPVWLMRQAGRYLPEYRRLREKCGSFLAACQNPEVAATITLQPLARFDLDAAIIFSDILVVPAAMGMALSFEAGEGPKFAAPIRSLADIERLRMPEVHQDLGYVMKAIEWVVRDLNGKVPVIGFAGSPWTVATYMVEGGGSKNFAAIKKMLYAEPQWLHALLEKITSATIAYLTAQIQAGAKALMLFDTWGGVLTTAAYREFSLHYAQKIAQHLRESPLTASVPFVFFSKGGATWLESMAAAGFSALGVDWTVDLGAAQRRVGKAVALQGNLDPIVLLTDPGCVQKEVRNCLQHWDFAEPGLVFNVGHGLLPETKIDNVAALVEAVHQYRERD